MTLKFRMTNIELCIAEWQPIIYPILTGPNGVFIFPSISQTFTKLKMDQDIDLLFILVSMWKDFFFPNGSLSWYFINPSFNHDPSWINCTYQDASNEASSIPLWSIGLKRSVKGNGTFAEIYQTYNPSLIMKSKRLNG